MTPPLVVMDVGDVLIRTVPMAHHRQLARHTGLPCQQVADRIENSGIVTSFETGQLTATGFVDTLRRLLPRPGLTAAAVEHAWNAVIADPDLILAPIAAELAAEKRLVLASNTNPFHWRLVHARLAGVGIRAPALLSFEIGAAKPDPRFFAALQSVPRGDHPVVYVDDLPENVAAARRCGLTGWVHRDARETSAYLGQLPT